MTITQRSFVLQEEQLTSSEALVADFQKNLHQRDSELKALKQKVIQCLYLPGTVLYTIMVYSYNNILFTHAFPDTGPGTHI